MSHAPDDQSRRRPTEWRPTGLRAAVIELMSRSGGAALNERELRIALRALVVVSHASALGAIYHGGRHDPRARIFADYSD